jgi:hypothetical protein
MVRGLGIRVSLPWPPASWECAVCSGNKKAVCRCGDGAWWATEMTHNCAPAVPRDHSVCLAPRTPWLASCIVASLGLVWSLCVSSPTHYAHSHRVVLFADLKENGPIIGPIPSMGCIALVDWAIVAISR